MPIRRDDPTSARLVAPSFQIFPSQTRRNGQRHRLDRKIASHMHRGANPACIISNDKAPCDTPKRLSWWHKVAQTHPSTSEIPFRSIAYDTRPCQTVTRVDREA